VAIRIKGNLQIQALEQGLKAIVGRHESLRATFTTIGSQPCQVINPTLRLELPLIDITELPEPEREAVALQISTEEARLPFDLARGPMVRASIILLCVDDYLLMVTMHHSVADGWSMGVFIDELASLYKGFSTAKPIML